MQVINSPRECSQVQKGDQFFTSSHVGFVESCEGTTITIIDGNPSVARRTRRLSSVTAVARYKKC